MSTEVGFTTQAGQTFTSGVQGFANAAAPATRNPNAVSPNAIRWLFNPFAYVDISDRPISGHLNLKAGQFIPIVSQNERVSKSGISTSPGKAWDWQNADTSPQETGTAESGAPQGTFSNRTRTAFAIATELEDAYSDRGVRILASLTKFDNLEAVGALYNELVADGLVFNPDPYHPEFPVPNLVILETHLQNIAMPRAHNVKGDLEINPVDVVADLLMSVRTAIQHCRNATRDAKRGVANRTQGRTHAFDAYETRCFIALGEQVPSDLPFVSESGHMAAPATLPVAQTGEIDRLRAENEALRNEINQREIQALRAEIEALRNGGAVQAAPTEPEKVATAKCSFIKADGTPCKATPEPDSERCRYHPLETVETQGESNDRQEENASE